MPTYEYECNSCGHKLEAWQKMSEDPLTECPQCHQAALRKVLSAVGGFHLKGSGWYATDFKDKKTNAMWRQYRNLPGVSCCNHLLVKNTD